MPAETEMGRASKTFFATCAFAALIACGSETEAADRNGPGDGKETGATANLAQASRAATPAVSRLPIEPGLYVSEYEDSGCGATTELFFYDGVSIGEVSINIRNTPRGHFLSSERITHVGPPRGVRLMPEFVEASQGFTLVWTTAQTDQGHPPGSETSAALALKSTDPGRFVRLRSGGNRIISYTEETLQRCDFTRLSPGMQAGVRDQLPQLAGPVATGSPIPNTLAFPPIPQGYYARDRDCRAVLAEAVRGESENLYLFNQRGLRDFMGWTTVVSAFEPLGGNRHRARAQMFDENDNPANADFTIAVTGANSFTIEATADTPAERYTHCPDNQVPRAVREGYEF